MATFLMGPMPDWTVDVDEYGYRTYKISFRVAATVHDGPQQVLLTPGLPTPGLPWQFFNDYDPWVWCRPQRSIRPLITDEPTGDDVNLGQYFLVDCTYSNKPPEQNQQRCNTIQIENPLQEPPKISGGYSRRAEEAFTDRFGQTVINSSHELLSGPKIEFDVSVPNVRIEQNVPFLNLAVLNSMRDCVNAIPMWGFNARCVRLANISWSYEYWGLCLLYFKRILEFEIDPRTFDRDILDEGTMVLRGAWDQDPSSSTYRRYLVERYTVPHADAGKELDQRNPANFIRYKDRDGEDGKTLLSSGRPYDLEETHQIARTAEVTSPGALAVHEVGEILQLTGGTFTSAAQVRVVSTLADGGIDAVRIHRRGVYTATPSNPVAASTVTGTFGGTTNFNLTWITVAAAGPGVIHVEKYLSANLFNLGGIPVSIG